MVFLVYFFHKPTLMPCSFISHLQFKRISQQKIAMSPDILVCSIFIASFIFVDDCKAVKSYTSRRDKKRIYEKKLILLPVNWKVPTGF